MTEAELRAELSAGVSKTNWVFFSPRWSDPSQRFTIFSTLYAEDSQIPSPAHTSPSYAPTDYIKEFSRHFLMSFPQGHCMQHPPSSRLHLSVSKPVLLPELFVLVNDTTPWPATWVEFCPLQIYTMKFPSPILIMGPYLEIE